MFGIEPWAILGSGVSCLFDWVCGFGVAWLGSRDDSPWLGAWGPRLCQSFGDLGARGPILSFYFYIPYSYHFYSFQPNKIILIPHLIIFTIHSFFSH